MHSFINYGSIYLMDIDNIYIHSYPKSYPDHDFVHMIESPKFHNYVYDESFPYRLKDPKSKFIKFWVKVVILLIVKPFCYVRYGLRIKGKKNIRIYKRMCGKKAMISICNHTTEWDTLLVMTSRFFHFLEFPMWQEGAESKGGNFYRYAGGLVLPTYSYEGMNYAYEAMRDVLKEGKWLHVFPEAACWSFYPAIRSFKTGIFKLAVEENMPILPTVVKYRKPKGLYRLFKKQPNATLIIGAPIKPDFELEKNERITDLCNRCRVKMMNMLGLDEESNEKLRASLPTYHVEYKEFLK